MTDTALPLDTWLDHHLAAGHCPGAALLVERAGRPLARLVAGHVQPPARLVAGQVEPTARPAAGLAGPPGDWATTAPVPMHAGVRFRIASLTKPMVTAVALMLVDDGRLALDEPVATWLPELAALHGPDGRPPQRPPTVRDLMRHTSGLAYPFEIADATLRQAWLGAGFSAALDGLTATDFLARLARLPLVAEPGTAFRYGYSTDVLGCLVERIEGQPLAAVMQQRLFGPLGMGRTGFELLAGEADDPAALAKAHAGDAGWHAAIPNIGRRTPGAPSMDSGGGGLLSTLDDVAAFGRLLADGGMAAGTRLLSAAALAQMFDNQLPAGVDGPAAYCGPGFGFGLGLAIRLDWGPAAMPCSAGEGVWSGISGTALFVQPRQRWFAVLMSANMASRMMARMDFRRAVQRLHPPADMP